MSRKKVYGSIIVSLEIIIPRYSRIDDRSLPLLPSLSLLNQPPAPFILELRGRTV